MQKCDACRLKLGVRPLGCCVARHTEMFLWVDQLPNSRSRRYFSFLSSALTGTSSMITSVFYSRSKSSRWGQCVWTPDVRDSYSFVSGSQCHTITLSNSGCWCITKFLTIVDLPQLGLPIKMHRKGCAKLPILALSNFSWKPLSSHGKAMIDWGNSFWSLVTTFEDLLAVGIIYNISIFLK